MVDAQRLPPGVKRVLMKPRRINSAPKIKAVPLAAQRDRVLAASGGAARRFATLTSPIGRLSPKDIPFWRVIVEVWLRTNARAMWLATILPATVAIAGMVILIGWGNSTATIWPRVAGGVLVGLGVAAVATLAWQARQPRLGYDDGYLLVWLRRGPPLRVPIELVECFWLGQAPSLLPGKRHVNSETASVVVRIAERAPEWRQQQVSPQLGSWCEGYITIRGTWCEPLSIDLINRLNSRLAEVTRASEQT